MKHDELILLCDYKGHFGSKYKSVPYRSGLDLGLLEKYFLKNSYKIRILSFSDIDFTLNEYKNKIVIYTSQEDNDYLYKNYIEDIILGLEYAKAIVIPPYKYLRANNNKIFMEVLREQLQDKKIKNICSKHFGTYEEAWRNKAKFRFPIVIKSAGGALSSGVYLAKNEKQLSKNIKKISRSKNIKAELWDIVRKLKHKGYSPETIYRKKFITQNFVGGLKNDWKVLVFGKKFFVLKRLNRKKDFRASGGGRLIFETKLPTGLLDFAEICFNALNVPSVSLDIAFNGEEFFLFEFQALYFGTYTVEHSDIYYTRSNGKWSLFNEKSIIEECFVNSISEFIGKNESSFYK